MKAPAVARTRKPLVSFVPPKLNSAWMHPLVGLTITDPAAREEIFHRAYATWESEGHPEHRDLDHWLKAEAAVLQSLTAATRWPGSKFRNSEARA